MLWALSEAAQAQTRAPAAIDPKMILSVEALHEDYDRLRSALEEAHGGYDRFASRAEVGRRLGAYRARLDRPMAVTEFAGILAEAVAELRDGHARLELDSATRPRLRSAPVFPMEVALEEDRLVVLRNGSPDDTSLRPGMEIHEINGRSVAEILSILRPKVPADGFIESGPRARLAREFASLYWLYVDSSDRFEIEASSESGRAEKVVVPGVRLSERRRTSNPANRQLEDSPVQVGRPSEAVALSFPVDGVAHLRIGTFGGDDFASDLDEAFRRVRDHGVSGLILDLRGNGGGVDEYGAQLVGHFKSSPFRYFDRIHVTTLAPSFATWREDTLTEMREGTVADPSGGFLVTPARHPGVGVQQPARQPFEGRVVVLIDGGTFSTAADVAAHLRSDGKAVFVGEETGGTYEGNTSGLNADIELPHSGISVRIMMYEYWNAVDAPAKTGRGVIPDYEVALRMSDVLRGSDPQLERALALLNVP